MRVYVYGDEAAEMVRLCAATVAIEGHERAADPAAAHVAIAPLLRQKLSPAEVAKPLLGTLIFHPSLLPRHRGPDAVKWAVASGERFTGVTWFWADEGLDTGPVCEQDVVAIKPGVKPRELYAGKLIPAGLRCLKRLLLDLSRGHRRAVPQNDEAATYESWYESREPRP